MAAVRHLELLCANAGQPTKCNWSLETCGQIYVDRVCSLEDIFNRKFCKFGFKTHQTWNGI